MESEGHESIDPSGMAGRDSMDPKRRGQHDRDRGRRSQHLPSLSRVPRLAHAALAGAAWAIALAAFITADLELQLLIKTWHLQDPIAPALRQAILAAPTIGAVACTTHTVLIFWRPK